MAQRKRDSNPRSSAVEADALITRPTRRSSEEENKVSGHGARETGYRMVHQGTCYTGVALFLQHVSVRLGQVIHHLLLFRRAVCSASPCVFLGPLLQLDFSNFLFIDLLVDSTFLLLVYSLPFLWLSFFFQFEFSCI